MAINVADVLRFPDIVLGKEVTIEGWKPFLTGINDFDTLISDNPLLMPDEEPIHIKIELGLRSPVNDAIESCKVQIKGTITSINTEQRIIEISKLSKIIYEIYTYRMREYVFPQGIKPDSIRFKLDTIPIKYLLEYLDVYMGTRTHIGGVILKTDAGYTLTHQDFIIRRVGWRTRLNPNPNKVEESLTRYNEELPSEYQKSLYINAKNGVEENVIPVSGPIRIVENVEIIATVMPTDQPHFPAQLDNAVLINHIPYANKIRVETI